MLVRWTPPTVELTGRPRGISARGAQLGARPGGGTCWPGSPTTWSPTGWPSSHSGGRPAAAGTTHKVLLYYFDGPEDLIQQALARLRDRRRTSALSAAAETSGTLGERVRVTWPSLVDDEAAPVLDQAIGLAMADPGRYADLARVASQHFLPALTALFPPAWSDRRKREVAEMTFATLRGLLIEWRTTGDTAGIAAGLNALARALDREEAAER